jgi:hypothetical protein
MEPTIDTGDHVRHEPTGESWVVACVQGDKLSWCGWPEGMAELKDCTLILKVDEEKRLALLQQIAASGGNDHRVRYAIAALAKADALYRAREHVGVRDGTR